MKMYISLPAVEVNNHLLFVSGVILSNTLYANSRPKISTCVKSTKSKSHGVDDVMEAGQGVNLYPMEPDN